MPSNEFLVIGFAIWVTVLGLYDWKFRGAALKMFFPLFGLAIIAGILDLNPNGGGSFMTSAALTAILFIFNNLYSVERFRAGKSKIGFIGQGDILVLIPFVWVFVGLPSFVLLGISVAISIVYSHYAVKRHIPYVTCLAISILMMLPFILTGLLK